MGVSRAAQFLGVPPITSGTGKAMDLGLGLGLAVDVVRESRKFSGHQCIGRIARSSLR